MDFVAVEIADRATAQLGPNDVSTTQKAARAASPKAVSNDSATLTITIFTLLATLIHGYHPYAEDAGIYISGIKLALNPMLYPVDAQFVTAHTALSIFSGFMATLTRLIHTPLEYVLFGVQVATTWLLIFSCWQLARRCFINPAARLGAITLVTVCLTLPVAGTSLFMMDPYVTGRSFSTPYILLAICGCLDRRWLATLLPLAIAALFHPLMAIYASGFLLMLWASQEKRWNVVAALCIASITTGMALQYSQRNVTETNAYVAAALTRTFFYLSQWQWYEWTGLAAPLLMMLAWLRRSRSRGQRMEAQLALCAASIAAGLSSIAVSLLFSHPWSHSHLVARLQPLRAFHIIYLVFFVLLGGILGQYWLKRVAWRWAAGFITVAAIMFSAQRATYPSLSHLEMPWQRQNISSQTTSPQQNYWKQAFIWVRHNTPTDAVFALDANYITMPDEDSQGFRAMAERSSLADYSKDGGASAIFPQLAPDWMTQHTADTGLSSMTDQQRINRLAPFGITWLVLLRTAHTDFTCPYSNAEVMVCRMPPTTTAFLQ